MANILLTYESEKLRIESDNGITVFDRFTTRINKNDPQKIFIISDIKDNYAVFDIDFSKDTVYLNSVQLNTPTDLQSELKKGYTYKLVEYNSTETYNKITLLDADQNVISVKEIFLGVTIANIPTISTVIDVSKNIIIKI